MPLRLSRRDILLGGIAFLAVRDAAADQSPQGYDAALATARGQTVYFNAWGGDQRINDYIGWVGTVVEARFGIVLRHVKLTDTAQAVTRVMAEKIAGRIDGGSIDLIWINGENFAAMKQEGLLFGPILHLLPNMHFVDPVATPTVLTDFTVPTDGYESPWGLAQLVFFHDAARLKSPPKSLSALGAWAAANPGRFTYPAPPDFIGSTFLKQCLLTFAPRRAPLAHQMQAPDFAGATAPLWQYLDALSPSLWRSGLGYPVSSTALRQLLNDGEIDISMAFNPGDASSAIAQGLLPSTVRSFVFDGGTVGNMHYVAIPFNANARAGAVVVANFLLSPEAQARKQDADVWGDPTVLSMPLLGEADRRLFAELKLGIATLSPEDLGPVLPEPHPSWMTAIEAVWTKRYGH